MQQVVSKAHASSEPCEAREPSPSKDCDAGSKEASGTLGWPSGEEGGKSKAMKKRARKYKVRVNRCIAWCPPCCARI